MGDFGVPIAIVIMVLVDMMMEETFTEKLKGPSMSIPNNFNRQIYPPNSPLVFMVINFYLSNLLVIFMITNPNHNFFVVEIF